MGSELDPIWVPTAQDISRARVTAFAEFVARRYGYRGSTYLDLWQWSVASLDDFWDAVWTFFDVQSPTPYRRTRDGTMPHVRWFDGAEVSYVAHLFRDRPANAVAIIDLQDGAAPEQRPARYLTWAQLRAEVAAVAAELRRLGCGRAVGPQRGRRTRRHRPDAVDAYQILGRRRRKPLSQFLFRYLPWSVAPW
jgi:acetoacetyl-CoA synthetase